MARAALSALLSDASGGIDGVVIVRSRNGTVIRRKAKYNYPKNPAQMAGALRFRAATQVWKTLTGDEADAWARHAETITRFNSTTGEEYEPIGRNVFLGLAVKVLQVDAMSEVPRLPPVGEFTGDNVTLAGTGAVGHALFTSSGPNSSETVTELLVQPLTDERQKPGKRYKSAAFASFAPGSLQASVPLAAGWYALAYRFVEAASGRATGLLLLGRVEVV